jgi:hypothetical protein
MLTLRVAPGFGRFLPSAGVIGVGFMLRFSLILAAFVGALLLFRGSAAAVAILDQASTLAFAAGGIAGESVIGRNHRHPDGDRRARLGPRASDSGGLEPCPASGARRR